MLRRARTILCGLSFLPFLALCIAWPIARGRPIGIWHKKTKTDLYQEIITSSHYRFFTIHNNQIELGEWRDPRLVRQIRQSLSGERIPVPGSDMITRLQLARATPIHKNFSSPDRFFFPDGLHTGPNPRDPWPTEPTHTWSHAGISIERQASGQILVHRLILPIWLPLLLLAAPPLLRLRAIYRNYRRHHSNLCPSCGYDLRATPTLCPECGRTTDAALSQ